MDFTTEIVSFMDLLDLDEDLIDKRAKNIMERSSFTNQHLHNFINLLMYKQLINNREESECCNQDEFSFLAKLTNNANFENIETICKIIKIALKLHPSTIVDKSEHLLQQILYNIYLPDPNTLMSHNEESKESNNSLLHLKICGSILEAVSECGFTLQMPFFERPLEHLIYSKHEKVQIYFLMNTVTQFFDSLTGFNILDRIWNLMRLKKTNIDIALKVLCCLSNYYLPIGEGANEKELDSDVIFHSEFWDFVLLGLSYVGNTTLKKQAIYLVKRAIDCAFINDKYINITSTSNFHWNHKNKIKLKKMWDNYFILLDSLDEKQGNIVIPSLKLFDAVSDVGHCWLICAFNIGLAHDNAQVRLKCLQYRLNLKVISKKEALPILETTNNINLFENEVEYVTLKHKLRNSFGDMNTLINILKAVPLVKWSPVPLYHLSEVLASLKQTFDEMYKHQLIELIENILKIPCNHKTLRKAFYVNISHFIGNCCTDLTWKEYLSIYCKLKLDRESLDKNCKNPFIEYIRKEMLVNDKKQLLQLITYSYESIDFALLYFEACKTSELSVFIEDIISKIQEINNRPYSNKTQCLDQIIFLVNLYKKTIQREDTFFSTINAHSAEVLETVLQYTMTLLSSGVAIEPESLYKLFEGLDFLNHEIKLINDDCILQSYKNSISLLEDNITDFNKKLLAIFLLNSCLRCPTMLECRKHELLDLNTFLLIIAKLHFNDDPNKEYGGRLKNLFYERSCEIAHFLLSNVPYTVNENILKFISTTLESGGYGCLKWILRIFNKIIVQILENEKLMFDWQQFLHMLWKEIEDLKTNSQHLICIEEFTKVIIKDDFFSNHNYNKVITFYCNKLIEYASVKPAPVYFLVNQMSQLKLCTSYPHIMYLLSEVLLFNCVQRKDQRITDCTTVNILENPIYGVDRKSVIFNSHVKIRAICILAKVEDPDLLDTLCCYMREKVNGVLNKQRYHGNSQQEKALQTCVQTLLFVFLVSRNVNLNESKQWCELIMQKYSHQPYVRCCLEWFISLCTYRKVEPELQSLQQLDVSLLSKCMILYWIVSHQIKIGKCNKQEFEIAMEFLLSHTMGPVYSVRLYGQYMSAMLYHRHLASGLDYCREKYSHTIKIIDNTLKEADKATDKTYIKLKENYLVHSFDIVEDLTPCAIFWATNKFENNPEVVDYEFLKNALSEIDTAVDSKSNDDFSTEWKAFRKDNDCFLDKRKNTVQCTELSDGLNESGTIQKKYVPWKNMSDIDVSDTKQKKKQSKLILVASLIDKLPNLGGMARTSEVFGVNKFVMDSVRHLLDKQFQGLSVSAERWIDVEEVRPTNIRGYIMNMKSDGFSIVAAEQTSNSIPLQKFRFPEKTLLLLGHEKEGVPCDLLPLMDHCVEIPQQGVVRSLNVHVTAAIFIWEYTRQNIL